MIFLGVDLGERRIGFATADTECPVAIVLPAATVNNPTAIIKTIIDRVRECRAEAVIIGLPLSMNGRKGDKARAAEKVAGQLHSELNDPCRPAIKIELWDERLTTEEVRRLMVDNDVARKNRRTKIDSLAAQRILSSYLTARGAQTRNCPLPSSI